MHITPPDEVPTGEVLAHARDASWWDTPSTSGAKYYHREGSQDPDGVWAACSRRIMLSSGIPLRHANGLLCVKCWGSRTLTKEELETYKVSTDRSSEEHS